MAVVVAAVALAAIGAALLRGAGGRAVRPRLLGPRAGAEVVTVRQVRIDRARGDADRVRRVLLRAGDVADRHLVLILRRRGTAARQRRTAEHRERHQQRRRNRDRGREPRLQALHRLSTSRVASVLIPTSLPNIELQSGKNLRFPPHSSLDNPKQRRLEEPPTSCEPPYGGLASACVLKPLVGGALPRR